MNTPIHVNATTTATVHDTAQAIYDASLVLSPVEVLHINRIISRYTSEPQKIAFIRVYISTREFGDNE